MSKQRYTYSHSDFFDNGGERVGIHHFNDTREDAEVRIYTTDGAVYEAIKVHYPSTNWGDFTPSKYMLNRAKEA